MLVLDGPDISMYAGKGMLMNISGVLDDMDRENVLPAKIAGAKAMSAQTYGGKNDGESTGY